ncbi:MAG: FMN-binding protein [Gemmatimonadetes bacterium]|nr:FMN-binding protein [Gemmatimonadota bacterium]NIR79754.1 FMN-binding protein [Gemmatimonadota bacterium]NIT88450.1 FMN-binding protein [Gemmatimonadota bacterium]NIU32273.1 FMN-binding protein [Gemmatimonadota bacterium]NIU36814.1 FMN-binding protein [Gemmatimonadota bacterium]
MSGEAERPRAASGRGGEPSPAPRQPPAALLVGTLGLLASLAGLGIVLVYQWANPRIEAHRARQLRSAIGEVLGSPERYETRWIADGTLLDGGAPGLDTASATPVYAGYDEGGRLVGFAVAGQKAGYQDVVRLIFGYDPGEDRVLGMKVLESKETPGLGAKITSDSSFIGEFRGVETPLFGVKDGGDAPDEVDMITGATISSEAVIEIINERVESLGPVLRDGPTSATTASARRPGRGSGPGAGAPPPFGGEGGRP